MRIGIIIVMHEEMSVGKHDWYRKTEWSITDEEQFFARLSRSRRDDTRCQYLRIQALYLANKQPEVALRLLSMYSESCVGQFDCAEAFSQQSVLFFRLGQTREALLSIKRALEHEESQSWVKTDAYLTYTEMVILGEIESEYDSALKLLLKSAGRPFFPVQHFRWNATVALLLDARGKHDEAVKHARLAFEAAGIEASVLRYHRTLGLVGEDQIPLLERLSKFTQA
jgi:tetratricopeptide (TPR) repeat protein